MAGVKRVYLSLGSNVGERERNIERALEELERARVRVTKRSSLYETAPQDMADQPWFLNLVAETETTVLPLQLLAILHRIERELGRDRSKGVRRGPRTIDLDILLFGRATVDGPGLTIPHPRMKARRFVLEPLLEIAPDLRDPASGVLFRDALLEVRDQPLRRFST